MNLLEYAKSAEPCQRNWNEEEVLPSEHIDYISEVCTTMPTKQNLNCYKLLVITNRSVIDQIFLAAYDPRESRKTFGKNAQVRANCVFAWIDGPDKVNRDNDFYINIGISSGAAALAAAELGYKTGFCKCFIEKEVVKIIRPFYKEVKLKRPVLMLGIGIPNPDFMRTLNVNNNVPLRESRSRGKKNIEVIKI